MTPPYLTRSASNALWFSRPHPVRKLKVVTVKRKSLEAVRGMNVEELKRWVDATN
jgi:hypothetical protein